MLSIFFALSPLEATAQIQNAPQGVVEQPLEKAPAKLDLENIGPALERPSVWGEPTSVRILLVVVDVDEVDSANQSFSASVYYEARWKSPLLAHDGPGAKVVSTTAVWTPRLSIVNQQQSWNAYPHFVEIAPDGEVHYRQKVWGWFSQPLNLRNFPFDQQTLKIHVVAAGLRPNEVSLVPLLLPDGARSRIAQSFSLPDFEVTSWNAEPRTYYVTEGAPGSSGFIMEIGLQRSANYFIWKLIFPLCLIVAMSWVPRWIEANEVGTAIGIAATSFLTLVAYLFATTVLLPRVSYFTRMDEFILMTNLMVFASLFQTVMMAAFVKKFERHTIRRINHWSRVLYPAALVAVLVASFGPWASI